MIHLPFRLLRLVGLRKICLVGTLFCVLGFSFSASADDFKVANAWVSLPAPYENPSAYFVIKNRDSKIRTIVGGSCNGCDWIEVRRVVFKDGRMGSEKLEEMAIPAGGAVAFVPRGLFLSLIGLSGLEAGGKLPIELEFADGEKITIEASVRKP
ncbi:MAG: copper chaperone PCu(A)C [Myxococcota bacterium]